MNWEFKLAFIFIILTIISGIINFFIPTEEIEEKCYDGYKNEIKGLTCYENQSTYPLFEYCICILGTLSILFAFWGFLDE